MDEQMYLIQSYDPYNFRYENVGWTKNPEVVAALSEALLLKIDAVDKVPTNVREIDFLSNLGGIEYTKGDATEPKGEGKKIIPHICNDYGAWGAGFVLAVSKKWKLPEEYYRAMPIYELGHVTFHDVTNDIIVANMIAQHGLRTDLDGNPPIRYDALQEALNKVNIVAVEMKATVHMPKIGAGLAGGDWNEIEKIIESSLMVKTMVYLFD